jgi:hypothetical protein
LYRQADLQRDDFAQPATGIRCPQDAYVGQVGNLRPSGIRPADQHANADQAEYHSAAGYHPAPQILQNLQYWEKYAALGFQAAAGW